MDSLEVTKAPAGSREPLISALASGFVPGLVPGLARLGSGLARRLDALPPPLGRALHRLRTRGERRRLHVIALAHIARRLPEIQASLDAAPPGFVYLAGDSHAELLGPDPFGGRPCVNGGIGGLSSRGYATYLAELSFPRRAGLALLFVGTNDIFAGSRPQSQARIDGFGQAVGQILDRLQASADRVVLCAVPPLEPGEQVRRDPGAVAAYSERLRSIAAGRGCGFADPFAEMREGHGGFAKSGYLHEGVHLRDYANLAAALAPTVAG